MSGYDIHLQTRRFKHLHTCHCFVKEKIVTTVYALLNKNNTKTYSRMLRLINSTANRNSFKFNPTKFYIDVDLNIISAIEETFGRGITIKLSLYHYANSIWYKVKSLGLSQNNDVNIEKTIRRMCFLAMVPVEQIEETWIKIKEEAPQNESNKTVL
uniref:Uncharacterized protein n=1 Tax=Schizaphis graminum TaxID=13262 RepID=A0A2S2PBF9_SCHGA